MFFSILFYFLKYNTVAYRQIDSKPQPTTHNLLQIVIIEATTYLYRLPRKFLFNRWSGFVLNNAG